MTPNYKKLRPTPLSRREFFGPEEQSSAGRVAILGPNTAAALFGDAGPLDETIRLDAAPFKVIGILQRQGANPGGGRQSYCLVNTASQSPSCGYRRTHFRSHAIASSKPTR